MRDYESIIVHSKEEYDQLKASREGRREASKSALEANS
jgi:hypothetical protein